MKKVQIVVAVAGEMTVDGAGQCLVKYQGPPNYFILNPGQGILPLLPVPRKLEIKAGDAPFTPADIQNLPQMPSVTAGFVLEIERRKHVIPPGMDQVVSRILISDLTQVLSDGVDVTGLIENRGLIVAFTGNPVDRPIHRP